MKNDRGFTLVEVIASFLLISIVLISFATLFVQSNKTAKFNNEKLVLINLADAELERIQALKFSTEAELDEYIKIHKLHTLAGKNFDITIEKKPSTLITNGISGASEKDLQLYNLTVSVAASDDPKTTKTYSTAEGYVSIEK